MKKLKQYSLLSMLIFFTACGTETIENNPDRVDMWNYMTSSLSYSVKYDVYENGVKTNYYEEDHRRLSEDNYESVSADGVTSLYLTGSTITMQEPEQEVIINRYLYEGDENIFSGEFIDNCTFEQYYRDYEVKGEIFHEVVMVACTSISGVKQEYYYGYNEGLVYQYVDDGVSAHERIKVQENIL